jgi:cytidylate kinase
VDLEDHAAVADVVAVGDIDYAGGEVMLDGERVTAEVRSPAVTQAVSPVSAIAEVRRICVDMQRSWVDRIGGQAVVEGRDIGSVVFPNAPVKVFLTASPEIRAARRAGDAETGDATVSEVAAELQRRDHHDSTRTVSPLRPADDAVVLDTGALDVDAVVDAVLALVDGAERRARYEG